MKNLFIILALVASIFACGEDDITPDFATNVIGTFEGVFQNQQGFQNIDYQVVVTKVSNTRVKITPEDSNGTAFEIDIIGTNGVYVSNDNTLTFQTISGAFSLDYNNTSDQFTGVRQ